MYRTARCGGRNRIRAESSTRSISERSSWSTAPTCSGTPRSFCRNDADAEDLAQTAVVRALASGAEVRNPERAKWYLFKIVRNLATDQARVRSRFAVEPWADLPDAASADPAPDARLLHDEEHVVPRPRSPSSPAFTRRCCGSGSSRTSTTPPSPNDSRRPSRRRASASTARCRPCARSPNDTNSSASSASTTPRRVSAPLPRQRDAVGAPKALRKCGISQRAVRGHPSPPRGGGGGRGHEPRSGGRAPG